MVDFTMTPPGSRLTYRYRSDALEAGAPGQANAQPDGVTVQEVDGTAFVSVALPAAGMAILAL